MTKTSLQEEHVEKAMEKLFKCIKPFEMALRPSHGDLAVKAKQQPVDAGAIVARMRDLEECLCNIFWTLLLLTHYEYKDGESAKYWSSYALHKC
jgi:hypothetical protein